MTRLILEPKLECRKEVIASDEVVEHANDPTTIFVHTIGSLQQVELKTDDQSLITCDDIHYFRYFTKEQLAGDAAQTRPFSSDGAASLKKWDTFARKTVPFDVVVPWSMEWVRDGEKIGIMTFI